MNLYSAQLNKQFKQSECFLFFVLFLIASDIIFFMFSFLFSFFWSVEGEKKDEFIFEYKYIFFIFYNIILLILAINFFYMKLLLFFFASTKRFLFGSFGLDKRRIIQSV